MVSKAKSESKGDKKAAIKKFEFLDIAPADAAFRAYGKDLNNVFANAALAVFEIMANIKKVKDVEKRSVGAEGYDLKSLMFDWLSEVLYISSSENMLFSKFDIDIKERKESGETTFVLKAVCWGEKMDPKRHELDSEVKAITYHKMEVKKEGKKWKAQVVVDL